ncbi:hypothetical protein Tco_0792945 [Tanacetum coccineum]
MAYHPLHRSAFIHYPHIHKLHRSLKAVTSKPSKRPKINIIPPKQLFVDLTQYDTKTPSPKHQLLSPSAPNAPSKTPSTKGTSSSSIDYTPKSLTSSTSSSTNGYLNLPTSPPLRVPPPSLTHENALMDITLTPSPITLLDIVDSALTLNTSHPESNLARLAERLVDQPPDPSSNLLRDAYRCRSSSHGLKILTSASDVEIRRPRMNVYLIDEDGLVLYRYLPLNWNIIYDMRVALDMISCTLMSHWWMVIMRLLEDHIKDNVYASEWFT